MKKLSLGCLLFWMTVSLYPYFKHLVGAQESTLSHILYGIALVVPLVSMLILIDIHRKGEHAKGWLNSPIMWNGLFLAAQLVVLAFLIHTQVLGNFIAMRGTSMSAGLALSIGMYLMNHLDLGSQFENGLLGFLGVTFFMGALEIPYQIAGYALLWGDWVTWGNMSVVFIEQAMLAVPFMVIMVTYNIRPTKISYAGLIAWAAAFAVWLWVFDFWHISTWIIQYEPTLKVETVLNTPINWPAYFMNKVYCVTFAIIVIGMRRRPQKWASYDWEAFSSWNLLRLWWKKELCNRVQRLSGNTNARTIDVGCGSSQTITRFPKAVGVDYDEAKVAFMRSKGLDVYHMDAQQLAFSPSSFDLALCLEVIEHVPNPAKLMSELARVTAEQGKVIVATPDTSKRRWDVIWNLYCWTGGYYREDHSQKLTLDMMRELGQQHHLELEHHEYIMGCDLICVYRKVSNGKTS